MKKVKRGSLVYTDRYWGYDVQAFCDYQHLKVDYGKAFTRGRYYINGLEGFWSHAKTQLLKHHGISLQWLPIYLDENQFRYNNRNEDLFDLMHDALINPMPDILESPNE